MEKDNIKPIKGIVQGLLEDWQRQKILKEDVVKKTWQKAVGKKAARHTEVSSLKAGRLIVEVDESGWIYQLTLKKEDILKKLNKIFKDINIKQIQFRIGSFK